MVLLETERLLLRNYKEEDFSDIMKYFSNEEVSRYEDFYPMSENQVKKIITEWKDMDNRLVAELISILNQNGSLSLTIGKSGNTPVYTGNDIESSSFTVYLRESGDYSVIIDANNHEGSYSLDWSTVSSTSAPDAPTGNAE